MGNKLEQTKQKPFCFRVFKVTKKGTREMKDDYALPLIVIRRLSQEYEAAMLKHQWALAYQTAEKMVEMALKLQDLADD